MHSFGLEFVYFCSWKGRGKLVHGKPQSVFCLPGIVVPGCRTEGVLLLIEKNEALIFLILEELLY